MLEKQPKERQAQRLRRREGNQENRVTWLFLEEKVHQAGGRPDS